MTANLKILKGEQSKPETFHCLQHHVEVPQMPGLGLGVSAVE
jgi:hypothetical protein